MIECSIRLTEDQEKALSVIREGKRHTLLWGSSRSGKTWLLVYVIVLRALIFGGSRHLIYRLHLSDVINSIWMETLPAVVSKFQGLASKIRYNETRHVLFFPNHSEIWLAGVDDTRNADSVLGKEYATIYPNEASQIPYLTAWKVRTRLAQKIDRCQNREFADLNPTTKGHWTYKEFIKHENPIESKPGRIVKIDNPDIYANMQMNIQGNRANVDAAYIASLASAPASMRRRFYLGEYADDDGLLVFPFPPDGFHAGNDFAEWVAKVGAGNVRFSAGLDIGFDDADGFAIIAYCPKPRVTPVAGVRADMADRYASQQGIDGTPSDLSRLMKKRFLIYEYKARRTGLAELASAIGSGLATAEKLALSLGCSWSCYVYGDTGAGGKKMIYDLQYLHHLPIRPAYKRDKLAAIELMQDEVRAGNFLAPAAGAFAQEAEAIVWTKDPDTGEILREIDDKAFHPDMMDAILYAMRAIWVGGLI